MNVGFIGLGTMGSNAARNVRRAGFEMVVYDIRPEAVARQLGPGVEAGDSPADVLDRTDVVVSMVFGPEGGGTGGAGAEGLSLHRLQGQVLDRHDDLEPEADAGAGGGIRGQGRTCRSTRR